MIAALRRPLCQGLTQDEVYDYTWDAENRLISVGPVSQPVDGDKKLEFKYDYMGRRVEKRVYTYQSGWSVSDCRRFMYHGWLPLLELEVTDPGGPNEAVTTLRKCTWGLDLAGQSGGPASGRSIGEAGGIGGLLAVRDVPASKSYIYFHDANGNVGQLMDLSDGSIAAKYEYDAYGNITAKDGPYADANPFRFSTKYFDDDTGLSYFGYRYYAPRVGRWFNRDPMGSTAGPNLYAFCWSNPVDHADPLGLQTLQIDETLNTGAGFDYDDLERACATLFPTFDVNKWADEDEILEHLQTLGPTDVWVYVGHTWQDKKGHIVAIVEHDSFWYVLASVASLGSLFTEIEDENPWYNDGPRNDPVHVSDLQSAVYVDRKPPALVVLGACRGCELAEAYLDAGVRCVLCSDYEVPSSIAVTILKGFLRAACDTSRSLTLNEALTEANLNRLVDDSKYFKLRCGAGYGSKTLSELIEDGDNEP